MILSSGTRLGPYEIERPLGAGGMGEVYQARDSRLNRGVAIKVLLPAVANDPDRLARFRQEARILASLNHQNIAHIHGVEEAGEHWALVMELVQGPTLADRIVQGALPVEEALVIARQIAEALEAAHEQGVIHRDLKPGNIKVRLDGAVKVLDFGLAKALEYGPAAGIADRGDRFAESPTIPAAASAAGVIVGTVAYMPPEQLKGKPVDRRADLWAFGCVLYEMLTGRAPFEGAAVSEVLAKVIEREPDWTALPAKTPRSVRTLLRRCLEKDPRRRLDSAAAVRLEIDEAVAPSATIEFPSSDGGASARAAGWSVRSLVAVAALALIVGGITTWIVARRAPASASPVSRFGVTLPPAHPLAFSINDRDLALSADGTLLVYTAGTQSQLMVRQLDQLDAVPVAGVAHARAPFLSPDGHWIGFFDELDEGVTTGPVIQRSVLRKVSSAGGPPVALCRLTGASRGASWGPDDSIVVATSDTATGLLRVSAGGGEPVVLTKPDPAKDERDHYFPFVLPGGRGVLFTITRGGTEDRQVAVLDLKTGQRRTLMQGSQPEYIETGHLIYTNGGALWAVRFDLATLAVVGASVPVVDQVLTLGAADFALSRQGTLVYVPVRTSDTRSLVWIDRQGVEEPLPAPPRGYTRVRIAPDGKRVAVQIKDKENEVWTWDIGRGKLTRLVFGPASIALWTPDGKYIIFGSVGDAPDSFREGQPRANLFRRAADGTGTDERLTSSPHMQRANAISPDGKRLVFEELMPSAGYDLMVLSLDGTRQVEPLLQTPFDERNAAISPDGHWMAYESNESGQSEVYVRPFPNVADARHQISNGGGRAPVWAAHGHELFFVNRSSIMSAVVQLTPVFSAGDPTILFDAPSVVLDGRFIGSTVRVYDVSLDGQRFLTIKDNAVASEYAAPPASMIVVQNWFEELKRRVPVRSP